MKYLLKKPRERHWKGHQMFMHFQAGWTLKREWTTVFVCIRLCVSSPQKSAHMWGPTNKESIFQGLNLRLNQVKGLGFSERVYMYVSVTCIQYLSLTSFFLSVPVRGHLIDWWWWLSGLRFESNQSILWTFICSKINILWYVSRQVVYIVAHVGFLNTSQLFCAQTCFGKFRACL